MTKYILIPDLSAFHFWIFRFNLPRLTAWFKYYIYIATHVKCLRTVEASCLPRFEARTRSTCTSRYSDHCQPGEKKKPLITKLSDFVSKRDFCTWVYNYLRHIRQLFAVIGVNNYFTQPLLSCCNWNEKYHVIYCNNVPKMSQNYNKTSVRVTKVMVDPFLRFE